MRFWRLIELGQLLTFDVVQIGHVFFWCGFIKSVEIPVIF